MMKIALNILATGLIGLYVSSCSSHDADTSLTSKIKPWQTGQDDSAARVTLRNATHRASIDPEKVAAHELDLIFALQNSNSIETKKFFINELQLIGTDEAIETLSAYILTPELSSDAINALQSLHAAGHDVEDALNEPLKAAVGQIKIDLVKALGSIRSDDSLDTLESYMKDKNQALSLCAIRSVANIANEDSSEKLLEAINNTNNYFFSKAVNYNYLFAENLIEDDDFAEEHTLQVLSKIDKNKHTHLYIGGLQTLSKIKGPDFTEDLVKYMDDKNRQLAEGVSRILQASNDPAVNPTIIDNFSKSGNFYKQLALHTLIKRGDSNSSLLVAKSLKSNSQQLRVAATRLTSEVKESLVVPGLLELVGSESKIDQQEAVKALKRIPSDKSSHSVRNHYKTASPDVQARLMEIIKSKSEKQNADLALRETLSADKSVSKAAFNALKNIAEFHQLPQLVTMLKGSKSSSQIRGYQAAIVTASFGKADDVSKTILKEISPGTSSKTNLALIQTLNRVGGQAAFEGLTKLYDNGSETVQKEVIRALSKWQEIEQFNQLLKVARITEGSNKVLMTRGLFSLLVNSNLSLSRKKEYLKKLQKIADSREKDRISELIKKLN